MPRPQIETLLLALLAAIGSAAMADEATQSATAAPNAAVVAALPVMRPGPASAVPIAHDPIGRIIARVMIDGRGPFRFMLDTGASRTVLAAATLPLLGLPLNTHERVTVLGISGSVLAGTAPVAKLDSGTLHFQAMQVPVLSGPVFADIDGILGIDGLEGKTLTADFLRDTVSITGAYGGIPIGDAVVPGRLLAHGLLVVNCDIGDVHASAIIDTGSTRTLGNRALMNALQDEWPSRFTFPTGVVDATEVSQLAQLAQVPTVHMGEATIQDLYVTFGDFHVFNAWGLDRRPTLLIGMDVLGSFAEMTIDYRRKELGLLPKS